MTTVADQYLNISGYQFITLEHLPLLQADLSVFLQQQQVKGTVLIAEEGINVALCGSPNAIENCQNWFQQTPPFADLHFKSSYSSFLPFSKLKVKIRHEIISFGQAGLDPEHDAAPRLSALELKSWLDQGRRFTLLDTRNNYEIESGTFKQASNVDIDNFREFAEAAEKSDSIDKAAPIVTFCTGGVRCEKAAPWLLQNGFENVLQLDGGILAYFAACGGAHWEGNCFVFDDRVEIDSNAFETGAVLCKACHRAVSIEHQQSGEFVDGESCPACFVKPAAQPSPEPSAD